MIYRPMEQMEITRRGFLATSTASLFGLAGLDLRAAEARAEQARVRRERLWTTVCPYCAVGCGAIVYASAEGGLRVEGDPDHPINEGALCAKGSAMVQVADNPHRVTEVRYRAPGSSQWQRKDWQWALSEIARRIQRTRDATFRTVDAQGRLVWRTEGIGCLGGATLNNEECYLLSKLARALGIVFLEHQARLCHSSTVSALASTFGRGAMTNHWNDLANAAAILIAGANVAENHPVAFRWITRAKERGAVVICVDPRFTRTAAVADIYVPLRPGTDIALAGGLIHYALENDLVHRQYLITHTDAGFLVDERFQLEEGRFGPIEGGRYVRHTWQYQRDEDGKVREDPSLQHPRCVFQLLKRHFARYDLETVSRICGAPVEKLRAAAEAFLGTHRPDRSGSVLYAMGATQHTHGTQNIRAYAILQLLLGNIGVAGGGINALRGESNVQGSTDHGLMFDLLPGYLKCPAANEQSLAEHCRAHQPAAAGAGRPSQQQPYAAGLVSLLKAWWGDNAAPQNQFAYHWLPKKDGDCSYLTLFEAIERGQLRGLLVFGQNPAVSGPQVEREREALGRLEWLVVVDLFETETAAFWKRPGVDPRQIATEVFLLPAAAWLEKEGSLTNSARWVQWRRAVRNAPGDARSDLWILDQLYRRLRRLYAGAGPLARPVVELHWDYGDPPDPEAVAREINGWRVPRSPKATGGRQAETALLLESASQLKADGSTAAGNALYTGSYTAAGNQMARRGRSASDPSGLHADWAWCWPDNHRILYAAAGCDASGRPWDAAHAVVRYDWQQGRWRGDADDADMRPPPPRRPDGHMEPGGLAAFSTLEGGRARLFAPELADGPLPEHYEPLESPVANLLSPQQHTPLLQHAAAGPVGDRQQFPIVATTCRVSEHWLAGAMSRNCPWLVELVPDAFVEISRTLAAKHGIRNGDKVTVRSARGQITLHALVTDRLRPLVVAGRTVEQVAIVWHFGYQGLATGPSGNVLTPRAGDPAAAIPEYKAFLCQVEKAT